MYDEVISKIRESVDEEKILAEAYPKFSGEGYKPFKIDAKNFHEIKKSGADKKIAFIDAGNAEIIGSANFSLNLVRVCCVIYWGNKKISAKRFEILTFIKSINHDDEIHYKTLFFKTKNPIDLEEILFSSFDRTLMLGTNRAEISSVANAIRRFAELKLAKLIADEKMADIIILDGNLQSTLTNENKYLSELYESCSRNNLILAALSKTTSLFTGNGNLLGVVLHSISTYQSWIYHPIAEINNINHKADMFFVKLHNKSKHVFRFEIFNQQKKQAEETIGTLAAGCTDPIFIGYPYGMVEADRIARISNSEKDSLRALFLLKLGNRNIEKHLSSANAHQILDGISF